MSAMTTLWRVWAQCRTLLAASWLCLMAGVAGAHSFNESYVYFDVTETSLSGKIEVTVTELAKVLAQDAAATPALTEAQVAENFDTFAAYFGDHIALSSAGRPYAVEFTGVTFLGTEAGLFAQLLFRLPEITQTPVTIEMSYTALFADVDPAHRGYGLIATNTRNGMDENEGHISLFFAPGDAPQTLYLNDEKRLDAALTFIKHGMWQLWLGLDHVLFVSALLLTSVLGTRAGQPVAPNEMRAGLRRTGKAVVVFTLGYSLTLWLAMLGLVTLPLTLTNVLIALSVVALALSILLPPLQRFIWVMLFVFGLCHGFGFADALAPLGLDPAREELGIAGFNIGVLLGILALALLLFPLLHLLRDPETLRLLTLKIGAVALIVLSVFWLAAQTSDVFASAPMAMRAA